MAMTWGTGNVKKVFFDVYIATAENADIELGSATTVADVLTILEANTDGKIGALSAEPKISSSSKDGKEINNGSTVGNSKEVTVEFTMLELTDENYGDLVAMDGKSYSIVFFDEKSGVLLQAKQVTFDINLSSTGNGFEELPVTAKKEAATIGDVVDRKVYDLA